MTQFIGGALATSILAPDDIRLRDPMWCQIGFVLHDPTFETPASFATEWWPGGGLIGDGQDGMPTSVLPSWCRVYQAGGAGCAFGVVGVTVDQYGSPIAGCTVKLFRVADDSKLDEVVSGPDGSFTLRTQYYPALHYWVAFKTGSPNVQGVSSPTLIGT